MDEPRRAPVHPSLTRPLLLGGAERELVLINGTIIAALIFGVGFHWVSLHRDFARHGRPLGAHTRCQVRPHVRYQSYCPARPPIAAPPAWVYPSVED